MAKPLRPTEPGVKGVRRILRKEIEAALAAIGRRRISDRDIHDTRKILKRSRAALRLVREGLGGRTYRRENTTLRDASRPLSAVRDARILVLAFDDIVKGARPADRRAWRPFRASLVSGQKRLHAAGLRRRGTLRRVVKRLEASRKRVERWSPPRKGWRVLGAGLDRVYREGRRAHARARRRPSVENLHELRKQVKYLWHQVQVLEPIWPAILRDLGDQAHRLSDHLGEDHDLAMLERALRSSDERPRGAAGDKLSRRIANRRALLQRKGLALAARLYEEPPRAFVERVEGYWSAWRAEARAKERAESPEAEVRDASRRDARTNVNGRATLK